MLCCLHSLISAELLEGADSVGGQLHGSKECPFSGVTSSGRVWRKVLQGDAWSVSVRQIAACTYTYVDREQSQRNESACF